MARSSFTAQKLLGFLATNSSCSPRYFNYFAFHFYDSGRCFAALRVGRQFALENFSGFAVKIVFSSRYRRNGATLRGDSFRSFARAAGIVSSTRKYEGIERSTRRGDRTRRRQSPVAPHS